MEQLEKILKDTYNAFGKEEVVENPTCCFCGNPCENRWGNNPWPISKRESDRCCNVCNDTIVIPERLRQWQENKIIS